MRFKRMSSVALTIVIGLAVLATQSAGASEAEQLVDRVFGEGAITEMGDLTADGASDAVVSAIDHHFELYNGVALQGESTLFVRTVENSNDEATVVASARDQLCIINYRTGLGSITTCGDLEDVSRNGLVLTTKRPRAAEAVVIAVSPVGATAIGANGPDLNLTDGAIVMRANPDSVESLRFFAEQSPLSGIGVDVPEEPTEEEK